MRASLLIAAAASVLALSGCGQQTARAPCAPGKLCFHAGNVADPATLDPAKATGTWEHNVTSEMFTGLIAPDAADNNVPGMALSWTTSPDGLVWTFKLRDALWSDGQPVTADDFVFALRRVQEPATASEYAYLLYLIKGAQAINAGKAKSDTLGVRAIDRKTLEITLEHPAPYLLELLKHGTTYPVPAHVVRKWGDAWVRPEHIVSNGAYTLKSWVLGDRITLVKNPRFYEAEKVCFDEVNFYPISDRVSAERQVKRGELDMSDDIASNRVAYLRRPGQMPEYVNTHTYLGNTYLAFNASNPKFKDVRVRRALAMAIDRDFMTKKLRGAGEEPAYGFVPPGIANYPGGARVYWADWSFEQRQAEARRLLAAAGYTAAKPLRVTLLHRGLENGALFPAIQADWKAIGVPTELEGAESQVAYAAFRQRDFEIADVGWIADYNDAMNFLELNKSSTGSGNYGDYNNPAYDALLEAADNERDAVKRGLLLQRAEKLLIDDAPVTTIFFLVTKNLVNPNVTGFVDNITDHHPKRLMCFKDAEARRRAGR